jgi:hypothetical protein
MKLNKEEIFKSIKILKKDKLIELIDEAFVNMSSRTRQAVFAKFTIGKDINTGASKNVLEQIEDFYCRSINGNYYAPFNMNSKNYSYIPEETDEWFGDIELYLDTTCELVKNEQYELSVKCYKILFELIEKMEHGEDIVFAHEYGDWMICAKYDYVKYYIVAISKTCNSKEAANLLIPLLKKDSYQSFSDEVFSKSKRYLSKEQLGLIIEELELRKIKTTQ